MKKNTKVLLATGVFMLAFVYIVSFVFTSSIRNVQAADVPVRFSVGYFPDEYWGLEDAEGNVIVPPIYHWICDFHEGFAAVAITDDYGQILWGFMDTTGRITVSLIYDEVEPFVDNRAPARMGYYWGLINRAGQMVVPFDNTHEEVSIIAQVEALPEGIVPYNVEMLSWWEGVRPILPLHTPIRITDIGTGIYYYVISMSNGNHADVETITAEDTALLDESFNWVRTWSARPVWVTIGDRVFSAAIHNMPHEGWTVHGNNMNGHLCLHFYESRTHNTNQPVYHNVILRAQKIFELYNQARTAMEVINAPPAGLGAIPELTTVMIDSELVTFQTFRIGAGNFFRVRDLAYALNGTGAQFSLDWYGNGSLINITRGYEYIPTGNEMALISSVGLVAVRPTRAEVFVDGEQIHPMAFLVEDHSVFMLGDFGVALGLGVEVEESTGLVRVSTR